MNDNQIRSELERRAASTSSRPDWAKRVLLPAVWHEVDARPQRVMTSNWSPRLGVVAVVAALLILVIAVPRLAPQPPAASPIPGDSDVLSTADFSDLVSAGSLTGRTVLIQGRISATFHPVQAPLCVPPNGLCQLGSLDGPQIPVEARYTPTTDAPGAGSWTGEDGYHFPSVPIEGVLALRVLSEAEVEFIGLVHGTATGNGLTVADASALNPTTIGPDAAVLVRGYLVDTSRPGEFINIDCAANPYPVVSGLPNRYCKLTDFLSSLSPNTDFGPNPDRLRVQIGAADRFASNFQGREALYAISPRLYGGCDDGSPPPCWLWEVVARIDEAPSQPLPTPGEVPTVAPSLSPATGEIECSRAPSVSLTDHTGQVVSCVSHLGSEVLARNVSITNPGGDAHELQIDLRVSSCDIRALSLELWEPPVGHALGEGFRPTHALQIDRSETDITCVDSATEITSQTIQLVLDTPIDATDVNAFVTTGSVSSDTIETHGNTFALTLKAGTATYAAGSPIDVFATRDYLGPEPTTVLNYGVGFGFEQLDGTLAMWPVSRFSCGQPQDLQQGDAETDPYSKSGSWSGGDPNAAFYDEYIRDPQLRLPVGAYRHFASLSFTSGGACDGELIRLDTSIVVTVR